MRLDWFLKWTAPLESRTDAKEELKLFSRAELGLDVLAKLANMVACFLSERIPPTVSFRCGLSRAGDGDADLISRNGELGC